MHGFEAIGVGLGFVVPNTPEGVEVKRWGSGETKAEGSYEGEA